MPWPFPPRNGGKQLSRYGSRTWLRRRRQEGYKLLAFFSERLEALIANDGEGLKCVILDAEAISDFDSTAAEALENLDADLARIGADLWIARANGPLRQLLQVTGLTERLGAEHIYPSVRAAMVAYHVQYGAVDLTKNEPVEKGVIKL